MPIRSIWSALALGLTLASPLPAQQPPTLAPGTQVRIRWRGYPESLGGQVRALRGDTLVVRDSATQRETEVLLGALRTIEVYRGRGTGIAFTALGAVAGGVAGGLLARSLWSPPEPRGFIDLSIKLDREQTTVLGALAGASIFGLLGHSLGTAERWESLPLSSLRVGLAPLPAGRLGLGAAVTF